MTREQFIEKWQPAIASAASKHLNKSFIEDLNSLFEDQEQPTEELEWADCDRPDLKLIGSNLMKRFDVLFDSKDHKEDKMWPNNPPEWPVKFKLGRLYIQWSPEHGWWLMFEDIDSTLKHRASFESIDDATDFVLSLHELGHDS